MDSSLNQALFARAQESIVGGVNSPVRSFRAVDTPPLVVARAEGAYLYDADGRCYTDFLMSWGAIVLGHAHEEVRIAIEEALRRGNGYGITSGPEIELAELIRDAFPSIERLRLVNSGTEAVMSAVRLARGYTGRNKIVVFEGGYHGHSDGLLVRAGSGLATFGLPASAGVPASFTAETLVARYNDLEGTARLFAAHGKQIAAILVEPVAGNMGVVAPEAGFLEGLRALCDQAGALLILDEVITGFRLDWGGAQARFGVRPDLTTLGKIIGGGLPVGAFGGRREIMERLAPLGDVYQAGTLSGNPIVAAAGVAVLKTLRRTLPYAEMESKAARIEEALVSSKASVPLTVNRVGSIFTLFFTAGKVRDYESARKADADLYGRFFRGMLQAGILLAPSPWETCFLSTMHTEEHVRQFINSAQATLRSIAR